MNIKSKFKLKCIQCGGAKYIDDPYYDSAEWYVDVTCLTCGHSRTIEAKFLKDLLDRIEKR